MRTTKKAVAGAIVLAMSLTACSGSDAAGPDKAAGGGTLKVRIASAMQSTDPFREIGTGAWQLLRQVYEGLVSYDNDYNPIPMLAESWTTSDDELVYTFTLRDGVPFQNGDIMTSTDAKYSLDYYVANAVRGSQLGNISSVDVVDDLHFTVTLKRRQANFISLLANPIMIAVVPEGSADNDGLLTNPVGTGPFSIENFHNEARAVLKKFDDYAPIDIPSTFFGGRKEALVDTVEILSVPESQTAIAGIETGAYDIAMEVPGQDLDRIKGIDGVEVQSATSTNIEAAYINTSAAVIDDVQVRKAILTAIDKKSLVDATVAGQGEVTNSYVSELVSWYDEEAATYWPYTGGTDKAKQILAGSSYNGEDIEIIAGGPISQQTNATLIGQMLTEAGFTVSISKLDHGTYQTRLNNGDFQIAATGTPLRTPPDLLYGEWYCSHGDKVGRFGYCNSAYDDAYDDAKEIQDEGERNVAFAKLEIQLKDDAVVAPWYFTKALTAVRSYVKGYKVAPASFFNAWNISLEK